MHQASRSSIPAQSPRTRCEELRGRLAALANTIVDKVTVTWPTIPDGITDRDADIWEPLLAVADAAGRDWPERGRVAAVALVADFKESTPSLGVRLLADLRAVFGDNNVMSTGQAFCARCGGWIQPGTAWDLDHTTDRTGYLGPSHAPCNRAAGARKVNALRRQRSKWRRAMYERW